jgi:hypothetical protein
MSGVEVGGGVDVGSEVGAGVEVGVGPEAGGDVGFGAGRNPHATENSATSNPIINRTRLCKIIIFPLCR